MSNYKQFIMDFEDARPPCHREVWSKDGAVAFQHWSVMALAVIHEWDQRNPRSLHMAFDLLRWVADLPLNKMEAMVNGLPATVPNLLQYVEVGRRYQISKWKPKQLRAVLCGISTWCYGIAQRWGSDSRCSEAEYQLLMLPSVARIIDLAMDLVVIKETKNAA